MLFLSEYLDKHNFFKFLINTSRNKIVRAFVPDFFVDREDTMRDKDDSDGPDI